MLLRFAVVVSIPSGHPYPSSPIPNVRRKPPKSYRFHFFLSTRQPSSSPSYNSNSSSSPTCSKFNPLLNFPFLSPSSPLHHVKPYLLSEWDPIIKGWFCSAVSVCCLSSAVPKVGKLPSVLATATNPGRIVEVGLPLMVLATVNCAATYLQQALLWEAALNTVYNVRSSVFDSLLWRDLAFFEGSTGVLTGDVAFRITAEAADVGDTLYALLNMLVPSTLQMGAMASRMVSVSPSLSLASALAIPCLCLVVIYLGQKLRRISQKAHASAARLSSYLNEILPSMLIVKANNAEIKESSRFQNLLKDDLKNRLRKRKMKAFIPQIVQILGTGGLALLCAGPVLVSRSSFDSSTIISFVTSLALLIEPIKCVGKAYNELKQGEPAMERLFDLAKFTSQIGDKSGASELDYVEGDIKFCNVTFKYGDCMPYILNKLNLHVESGETVALIGPSGGGKTTLAKLLLRLYHPLSGNILLDDHDIQDIQLRSLRKHISFVPQDIVLFTGTVAENIAYKDLPSEVNMEQVRNAALIANADEFITKLPDGYNTNVGPKGSRLSGGQRQRLAIARAIYEQSSVLILDEATSALDSASELLVSQALERLMLYHTVVIIAHRLETVLIADRILLLECGRLEEISRSTFLERSGHSNLIA